MKRALVWLRRDLRTTDHTALWYATENFAEVAPVFVFDTNILNELQDKDDRRLTFIHKSLQEVDDRLRQAGSRLTVVYGDPMEWIPKLADAFGADEVVTARDYEPYAVKRDAAVHARLQKDGRGLTTVKDSVVLEQGEVLSKTGTAFRVYSPYARAWRNALVTKRDLIEYEPDFAKLVPASQLDGTFEKESTLAHWSLDRMGFQETELWIAPGEAAGKARLEAFRKAVDAYEEMRNIPDVDGTSILSPHFRFGTISIRSAVRFALERGSDGADKWLAELIWRDFYQDILANNPHVVTDSFDPAYRKLEYPGRDDHYQAWEEGQTGYPIIDAAMRMFNATGWMHNRLRMVVASFLTKDLLVDYRKGEAYFARKLLDFDLASNNGGWQWAASTGCDPQPYFRIFNPMSQSEKFDGQGNFIRKWCPELAGLTGKSIHAPWTATPLELRAAGIVLGETYPHPIVQHDVMRQKAIDLLAVARKEAKELKEAAESVSP